MILCEFVNLYMILSYIVYTSTKKRNHQGYARRDLSSRNKNKVTAQISWFIVWQSLIFSYMNTPTKFENSKIKRLQSPLKGNCFKVSKQISWFLQ